MNTEKETQQPKGKTVFTEYSTWKKGQHFITVYESAGTYTVKLKAMSKNGHKSDESSKTITIADYGKVSFWHMGNNPVNLTLQSHTMTVVYPCPSCAPPTDCNSGYSFTLSPATYSYSAQEQSPGTGTWSGIVVITGGDCHIIQF